MRLLRTQCFIGFLLACTPASAAPLPGIARAIDGDSLYVGQTEVRLFGIDAPEFTQSCTRNGQPWPCGRAAADQLAKLVTGKQVRCDRVDIDEHQRTVARCTVGSIDVNRTMVATGYAIAYRHYSLDYVSAEQSAKVNRRGLWSGKFLMPSDYRHEQDYHVGKRTLERPVKAASSRTAQQPSGGCAIKGNRGSHGWIYPGMPYYNQTHAEQMFCTEAEAQAAGYRRARSR